jgi:hypothetical protein
MASTGFSYRLSRKSPLYLKPQHVNNHRAKPPVGASPDQGKVKTMAWIF